MILPERLGSPRERDRYRTEIEAVARLEHPNIIPLHEVGEFDGKPYFTMKLVEAGSLASRRDDYILPEIDRTGRVRSGTTWSSQLLRGRQQRIARLIAKVARGVHYAHQRGLLHRDLKPANILLDGEEPLVTDFGIAKRLDTASHVTTTGALIGTPAYMSPEQAEGRSDISTAADVFSIGAICYELLTGRPPFLGDSPMQTLGNLLMTEATPASQRNKAVDRDLEAICQKCLHRDAARRYGTASELAEDLDRWLEGEPITARRVTVAERLFKWARRRPATAAGVGFGALAVLGVGATLAIMLPLVQASYDAERVARQQAEDRQRKVQIAFEDARRARDEAQTAAHNEQAARLREQERFNQLADVAVTYIDGYDAIAKLPGATRARIEFVTRAMDLLNALATSNESRASPDFIFRLSRAQLKAAEIRADLMDHTAARTLTQNAIQQLEQLNDVIRRTDPEGLKSLLISSTSHLTTAYVRLAQQARRNEDWQLYRKALQGQQDTADQLQQLAPDSYVARSNVAYALRYRAARRDLAIPARIETLNEALDIAQELRVHTDELHHTRRLTADLHESLADVHDIANNVPQALEQLIKAAAELDAMQAEDLYNVNLQIARTQLYSKIVSYARILEHAEIRADYAARMLATAQAFTGQNRELIGLQLGLQLARRQVAGAIRTDEPWHAIELLEQAARGYAEFNALPARNEESVFGEVISTADLSVLFADHGTPEQARRRATRAIDLCRDAEAQFGSVPRFLCVEAEMHRLLAELLLREGQLAPAGPHADSAMQICRSVLAIAAPQNLNYNCRVAETAGQLGRVYQAIGQFPQALEAVRFARDAITPLLGGEERIFAAGSHLRALLDEPRLLEMLGDRQAMMSAAMAARPFADLYLADLPGRQRITQFALLIHLDRAHACSLLALTTPRATPERIELLEEALAAHERVNEVLASLRPEQIPQDPGLQQDERFVERAENEQIIRASLSALRSGKTCEIVVVIKIILPGGQAQALNLQAGDIVREYAGQPVDSLDSFRRIHGAREPADGPAAMVLQHGQERLQLEIKPGRIGIAPAMLARPVE